MAHLIILDGALEGQRWEVEGRLTIGRHQQNQLQLPGGLVSRFHATVEPRPDGQCWLQDQGSTAGTLVNGERVIQQSLSEGDEIAIGDVKLRFVEESAASLEDLGETLEATQPMDQDTPFEFGTRVATVQQAYDEILQYLLSIVPAQRGLIILQQPGATGPAQVAVRDIGAPADPSVSLVHPRLISQAMETGEAVYSPSRIKHGTFNPHHAIQLGDTRCSIVAPLLAPGGEALGVIYLDSWDVFHQLDRRQVQWITAAAAPAARAIVRFANQETSTGEM